MNSNQPTAEQIATDNAIAARKREATEQANGAYIRAVNRGWSKAQADKCWHDCFETHMQE